MLTGRQALIIKAKIQNIKNELKINKDVYSLTKINELEDEKIRLISLLDNNKVGTRIEKPKNYFVDKKDYGDLETKPVYCVKKNKNEDFEEKYDNYYCTRSLHGGLIFLPKR